MSFHIEFLSQTDSTKPDVNTSAILIKAGERKTVLIPNRIACSGMAAIAFGSCLLCCAAGIYFTLAK